MNWRPFICNLLALLLCLKEHYTYSVFLSCIEVSGPYYGLQFFSPTPPSSISSYCTIYKEHRSFASSSAPQWFVPPCDLSFKHCFLRFFFPSLPLRFVFCPPEERPGAKKRKKRIVRVFPEKEREERKIKKETGWRRNN